MDAKKEEEERDMSKKFEIILLSQVMQTNTNHMLRTQTKLGFAVGKN